MIFSSAYAAVVSALVSLTDKSTFLLSDELNHNCIINAMRMSRPAGKGIYPHLDMAALDRQLESVPRGRRGGCSSSPTASSRCGATMRPSTKSWRSPRATTPTTPRTWWWWWTIRTASGPSGPRGGVPRSTRTAPPATSWWERWARLSASTAATSSRVPRLCDSCASRPPLYIYSNPITAGEAAAAMKSLEILTGPEGARRLGHLRALTKRFEAGLLERGFEIIPGDHPIVPIMVAQHLRDPAPRRGPLRRRRPGHRARVPGRPARRRVHPLPDQRRPHRGGHRPGSRGSVHRPQAAVAPPQKPRILVSPT